MVHIGIIPDGNRRWCTKNNYEINNLVHHWTKIIIETLSTNTNRKISKYLKEITEVSFYVCSIDNINRADNTKYLIFDLIRYIYNIYKDPKEFCKKQNIEYTDEQYKKMTNILENITINYIGDVDILPQDIQNIFNETKKNNKKSNDTDDENNKYTLNLAIAYDYHKDILNFGRTDLPNYIREQTDIDLIVRSGGEFRTSGFFPTKTLYSELFFLKKLWPEITINDFITTMKQYYKRNRRFGK